MAEEGSYLLTIQADGSGAIQAIDGLNGAFGRLVETHEAVKSRFQESFQHVGVHLFGRELLSMIGLGTESRVVLQALNLAVTSAAGAFDFMTGPVGLVIMGFTALAAITVKVLEHHKDHSEALAKLAASQESELLKTRELESTLASYNNALHGNVSEIDALSEATSNLDEVQTRHLTHTMGQQMAAAQAKIAADREQILEYDSQIARLEGLNKQLESWTNQYKTNVNLIHQYQAANQQANDSIVVQTQLFEKLKADISALGEGYVNAADRAKQLGQAAEAAEKQQEDATHKIDELLKGVYDRQASEQEKAATEHEQYVQKLISHIGTFESVSGKVFGEVGKVASDSFAKMVVEGKSFTESFEKMATHMEEMFVSLIAEMIMKWLAFQALTAGLGFSAEAVGPFMGMSHATGGMGVVTQPTLLLAGETGPEQYSFAPLGANRGSDISGGGGAGGVSSGGGDTYNIYVSNNFNGITDTAALSDQVGNSIIQRIRGRGDIAFQRVF